MSLTTNLVSYYKLDESSGNAVDSVGSNTLTNSGTVTYSAGKINNGAVFDASNYLSSSNTLIAAGSSEVSISCWFYSTGASNTNDLVWLAGNDASNGSIGIRVNGPSATIFARNSGGTYATSGNTGNMSNSVWYHLVGIFSGGQLTCYLNGVASTQGSLAGTVGGANIRIGYNQYGYAKSIDEVAIYSRALSTTEIAALYNDGLASQYAFTELKTAKVAVIGGGAGGGRATGGGGGAGGYQYNSAYYLSAQTYAVVVGAGGPGQKNTGNYAVNGSDSTFSTIVAYGGGGGATNGSKGQDGGCGGGCGSNYTGNVEGIGSQGQNGGDDPGNYAAPNYPAAGGGGQSTKGEDVPSTTRGGNGGDGVSNPIQASAIGQNVSSTYWLCGGGGGGTYSGGTLGTGGKGGGGAATVSGTANTGGGGGGDKDNNQTLSGDGGSGVVIIEYTTADFGGFTYSGTYTSGTSGSTTWVAMKGSGDLVLSAVASKGNFLTFF